MSKPSQTNLPFRWDLITPDRLGSMIADPPELDAGFLAALVDCSAKVVARSAGGDLVFVGRSLDSMFDLLGGVLDGCTQAPQMFRLPFSFSRDWTGTGTRSRRRPLTSDERAQARTMLSS